MMVLPNTRYRAQRKYIAFARQKMNQTANISDPAGNRVKVPMTSDATYPATVVDNVMTVVGGGIANVTLSVGGSGSIFGGVKVDLERNGVIVGTVETASQSNARSTLISGLTLVTGDQLIVWAARTAIGSISGDVRGAAVDVAPA
ncbi:hypothetical protein SEA_PCORAL7_33 [Gordonia phage PCoral7]|uniref:Minor tail protein n=1 Tax=Gordonia phage Toast TaxID=2599852 RepID=A0A5J6TCH1_9CAUD|nr:hypothetical protein JZX81_gp33 [Gordonia phage Toast]QFG08094.1 hypothetical protein PBI_TOAST_33 [Gordonia phage Toast]UVF60541.1 hypothetical protein SEA_PCORAL7_33 [Gordonia phage PCoral7]